jgi:phytoene dehydrogenase-like protein
VSTAAKANRPTGDPPIVVVGGGIAGLAAAVRLAKARHPVRLYEASDRLGGRWASRTRTFSGGTVVLDDAPPVLEFPAPWRDLYRKSGRTLADEFDRTAAALSAAEPARYVFADGTDLVWPTDRGELFAVHQRRYGTSTAQRWRALVDQLDDVWQTVRKLGWEAELTGKAELTGPVRRRIRQERTIADLAEEIDHPHLAAVLRAGAYRQGGDPETTPAWCAVSQSIERRFGRWTLQSDCVDDHQDRTGRTSTLVDALVARARLRRVDVRLNERVDLLDLDRGRVRGVVTTHERLAATVVVWTADPWQLSAAGLPRLRARHLRRGLRRLRPAPAPTVTHELLPPAADWAQARVEETITLDQAGVPTVTYRRSVTAGTLQTVHAWQHRHADPGAGAAWHGFDSWLDRPPIRSGVDRLLLAGPWSPAGNSAAATILSGALASYAVHELVS